MCDLGESIAIEAIQNKNIEHVRKLMIRLQISFKEAVSLLEIPENEVKEIEVYFKA